MLYAYCPYLVTFREYLAITLGVRLLALLTFSALMLLISVFAGHYVYAYAAGLSIAGVNFILHSLVMINSNSLVRTLNLFAAAAVQPLVFGWVCQHPQSYKAWAQTDMLCKAGICRDIGGCYDRAFQYSRCSCDMQQVFNAGTERAGTVT